MVQPAAFFETDAVDNESVPVPLSEGVTVPSRLGVLGKGSPVSPDRAPLVSSLKEHEDPAGDLNEFQWSAVEKDSRRSEGVTSGIFE